MTDSIINIALPPKLALPLTNLTGLKVKVGDSVSCGQLLSIDFDGSCLPAPVDGQILAHQKLPVIRDGTTNEQYCLILKTTPPKQKQTTINKITDIQTTLRHAGIVGLGGGGYPAWKKWRPHLRWFVVNAVESDPRLRCDDALLNEMGEKVIIEQVTSVGSLFANRTILVRRHQPSSPHWQHPIVKYVDSDYASGQERLLVENICQEKIPHPYILADWGIVCFNIATVIAMAKTLKENSPLSQRIATIHVNPLPPLNIRFFLGTALADIEKNLFDNGLTHEKNALSHITRLPSNAILSARTNLIEAQDNSSPLPKNTNACIRCLACQFVCPSNLNPMRLFHHIEDQRWLDLTQDNLSHCLGCRRCDDVCPSRLTLSDTFIHYQKQLIQQQQQRQRFYSWRTLYERRQKRKQRQSNRRLTISEVKNTVAQLLSRNK